MARANGRCQEWSVFYFRGAGKEAYRGGRIQGLPTQQEEEERVELTPKEPQTATAELELALMLLRRPPRMAVWLITVVFLGSGAVVLGPPPAMMALWWAPVAISFLCPASVAACNPLILLEFPATAAACEPSILFPCPATAAAYFPSTVLFCPATAAA